MIHTPGMVELINQETVPVWLNYSLHGFPRDLPAFEAHHRDTLPWFRLNSAHSILMDNDGLEFLGGGVEVVVMRALECTEFPRGASNDDDTFPKYKLEEGIARFHELHRLKDLAAADPGQQPALEEFLTGLHEWRDSAFLPNIEPRVWTGLIICDFLGPNPWRVFSERCRHPGPDMPEPLAPGVRNEALHAFARVAADNVPLIPIAQRVLDSYYQIWRQNNPDDPSLSAATRFARMHHDGSSFPYAVRYRAAKGAEMTAGVKLFNDSPDEDVVAIFKNWYATAKDDPRYAIEECDDPALKFAFFRQPYAESCSAPSCAAPGVGAK